MEALVLAWRYLTKRHRSGIPATSTRNGFTTLGSELAFQSLVSPGRIIASSPSAYERE